jgi:hypothetical protein
MSEFLRKNPCVDLCKFKGGVCRACGRTKAEKKQWKRLPPSERHAIWQRILESHGTGRGKRAAALRERHAKVSGNGAKGDGGKA